LVLMAIETDTMINKLNLGRRAAPIGPLFSALMQPLMVQMGTFTRFYLNNLRQAPNQALPLWMKVGGILVWMLALASFILTTWSVLDHIGPLQDYTDETAREEASALVFLAWLQVVYPLVSLIDALWMFSVRDEYKHNEYSPRLSTFKDIALGVADVGSKGGMCLIAFLVATGH
jgi:hypothetical protein